MDRQSRALNRFLVASPLVLIATIGFVGRLPASDHEGAAASPTYERQVRAYTERLKGVAALRNPYPRPDSEWVAEALRWRTEIADGTLKPVVAIAYEDHLREGPRGEIVRGAASLANQLVFIADRRSKANDFAGAADFAALGAEVMNLTKGFDLQTLLTACLYQRRATQRIGRILPKLSNEEATGIRNRLKALVTDPEMIKKLAKVEEQNLATYIRRQKVSPTSFTDTKERDAIEVRAITHSAMTTNRYLLDPKPVVQSTRYGSEEVLALFNP